MASLEANATNSVDDASIPDSPTAPAAGEDAPRWSLVTRLAFRFCFIYLGLFIVLEFLTFPEWILLNRIPSARIAIGDLPPFRAVVLWAMEHIFHLAKSRAPGIYENDGAIWVQVFCILCRSDRRYDSQVHFRPQPGWLPEASRVVSSCGSRLARRDDVCLRNPQGRPSSNVVSKA